MKKGSGKAFGPMPAFGRSLFGGDDDLNLAGGSIRVRLLNHNCFITPLLLRYCPSMANGLAELHRDSIDISFS